VRTGTSFYYPDRRRTSEEQPPCHGTRLDISSSWLEVYRISWRPRIFDRVRDAAFLPGAVPQQEFESAVAAAAVTALERRPPLRQDDHGPSTSPQDWKSYVPPYTRTNHCSCRYSPALLRLGHVVAGAAIMESSPYCCARRVL
jgi:hypothetical protein